MPIEIYESDNLKDKGYHAAGKTTLMVSQAYLAARYENKTTYIAVPKIKGMGKSVVVVPADKWEALQPPKSKIETASHENPDTNK